MKSVLLEKIISVVTSPVIRAVPPAFTENTTSTT